MRKWRLILAGKDFTIVFFKRFKGEPPKKFNHADYLGDKLEYLHFYRAWIGGQGDNTAFYAVDSMDD